MPEKDLFIVGIGASAGGLDAIQQLFDNIPDETGMAFVIVQHLSPNFKSLMPELLAKHTGMKIYTSEDKQVIEPNCVYLNQKNKNLYIKGKQLYLIDKSPKRDLNLPIDIFFHSLGEEHKDKSVGIILSGTGSDGSRGIKSIKETGGILMVQDPETAQFDGMPNSSIATGLIDFILSPEKIAETITKIPRHQILLSEAGTRSNRETYFQILNLIYKQTGVNFKQYKKKSLLRRLEKQMNINNFIKLEDYYLFLKNKPKKIESLKQDILIGVTDFFRDEEVFESLKNDVIPDLCTSKKNSDDTVRVWVPGCSTGEEVYTIAFLLDEYIKKERLNIDFKIFATDINEEALKKAGSGIYLFDAVNIPPKYSDTYFIKEGNKMKVIKRIRERIVFSKHNLLKDPPFIHMDLISCRNLLIYIEANTQNKILSNFLFALKKDAYLLLGSSESLGKQAPYFKIVSPKTNIYQCVTDVKRLSVEAMAEERVSMNLKKTDRYVPLSPKFEYQFKQNPENAFYKYMGQKFSPAMVFTDTDFNILFVNGDITTRLSLNQGIFQSNLLKLVNKEIASIMRSGIRKAEKENKEVIFTNVVNKIGDQSYCFDLGFQKITDFERFKAVYAIHFSKDKSIKEAKPIVISNVETDEINKQRVVELEEELKDNKAQLQYVVEQLETSNEELQSSNEELMASNEELQSTNEELQSVNEELYTVNTELQEKNKELAKVNDDMNNLLNATKIGTLFLDVDLRIRKFTPALQELFNLQAGDIGRSIGSFASNFKDDDSKSMIKDCKAVLKNLSIIETQVSNHEGEYFLRKISPFITDNKKIDGLVITFVNITRILQIELELKESESLYRTVFTNAGLGIATISSQGNILTLNPEFEAIFGYSAEQLKSRNFKDFVHPDDRHLRLKQYENLKDEKKNSSKTEMRYMHKNGHVIWGELTLTAAKDEQNNILYFVALLKDITKRKKANEELLQTKRKIELSEKRYRGLLQNTEIGVVVHDAQGDVVLNNPKASELLGLTEEQMKGKKAVDVYWQFIHEDLSPVFLEDYPVMTVLKSKKILRNRIQGVYKKKDEVVWLLINGFPILNSKGDIKEVFISFVDISKRKEFEKELKEAKQKAETANIYKNRFLANMSHEIRTPLSGVVGFADLLDNEELEDATRKKYVNIIKNSSRQLSNLINDIIDISKIEANELNLEIKDCNINELFDQLKTIFIEIKKQKNKSQITLEANCPEKYADLIIKTDPLRLQQVMINLIGNAVKYSDKGRIEFGFSVPDENKISFFVKDEGAGIPNDKLNVIFNRFEQLNTEDNPTVEGTGLGLAISKGIVELLNGKINVESKLGKGTCFSFTIPLIRGDKQKISKKDILPNTLNLREMSLLVADDNDMNIEYFKALFADFVGNIVYVKNGEEALEAYKNKPDFDAVLMDISMPGMNGVAAAEEIFKINPKAKIIAQTAYAMNADRKKFLDLGFVDYISKPIDKEKLIDKLKCLNNKNNNFI